MLLAFFAGLLVAVALLALIAGLAVRLCRRLGLDPLEVLWWFGLAERAAIHSGRQRPRELARAQLRLAAQK